MKHITAHPPEFLKPGDRFVVMIEVGKVKGAGFQGPAMEPLGYGAPGQPSPEMLLRRGIRCTGFKSEHEAFEHLEKSAALWKAAGLTFHHGKQIEIHKIEEYSP